MNLTLIEAALEKEINVLCVNPNPKDILCESLSKNLLMLD